MATVKSVIECDKAGTGIESYLVLIRGITNQVLSHATRLSQFRDLCLCVEFASPMFYFRFATTCPVSSWALGWKGRPVKVNWLKPVNIPGPRPYSCFK
jgi:hypothetical protein